jgi:hypothetical protein
MTTSARSNTAGGIGRRRDEDDVDPSPHHRLGERGQARQVGDEE